MEDSAIASLAKKAKQGDMQAFEQLYTEFSPLIYSILFEITHDSYEAENLAQDCFVSALKNIQTLKEPEKIKKWLTAIAANHGRDYLKKKKPALLGAEHEYIFEIKEEDDISLLPEASAELDERSEEIREIVNSISEDKRLCLVLFYQHDMSLTEISEELGISEGAVKTKLFRAREDLKKEVEKRNKKGMPLFGVAPLPLILFALRKTSEAACTSYAGSAAQAAAFTAVTAAADTAAVAAAATATGTAAASGVTATATTATAAATGTAATAAATGISVKIIAIAAAGAVAVGGGAVGAKVVHDRRAAETTTAIIEESTELSSENSAVTATGHESETQPTTESTTLTVSTVNGTTVLTVASAATDKATAAANTTQAVTTSQQTTITTEPTTAAKPETTAEQPTTVKPTATVGQTDAAAEPVPPTAAPTTTTKPVTTEKPTTTQAPTTASSSPATVTVTVYSAGSGSEYKTYNLTFDAGVTLSGSDIETELMNQHGIDAMADAFSVTTQSGGSYSATAYEI